MSFEGYYQLVCSAGHYSTIDVYNFSDSCICECGAKFVTENMVDETNGEGEGFNVELTKEPSYQESKIEGLIKENEKLREQLKREQDCVDYYANPELWMIKDKYSWRESSPKSHGDDELILKYRHPNRDWVGSVRVGGKLARETVAMRGGK